LLALRERMAEDERSNQPAIEVDDPRAGGWRPGAHWAKAASGDEWLEQRIARKRAKKEAILAEIEQLPLHQRPPMRELGRRSENLPHPFRAMPPDVAAQPRDRGAYDLEGAFWQQGRTLGGFVARVVSEASPARRGASEAWEDEGLLTKISPRTKSLPQAREGALVTTHRQGQRMVIAAACPAAQALGLAPGMALTQARALVPGLDIRPADPDGIAADLDRLAAHAARHWTPQVVVMPGEGLWLDIGAAAHLFGGEAGFARRVLALCRRLRLAARIAIADTAAAAHALAKCAAEPITLCPPGGGAEALASLPLSALQFDSDLTDRARRLGLETIGALATLPRAPLVRRFGQALVARLDEAIGRRARPIDQLVPVETPCAARRFAEPLLTAEPIAHALAELVRDLCSVLTIAQLGARFVALTLTRIDRVDQRIEIGLARPSRDGDHLLRLFGTKLDQVEPGFGIDAMRLVAERFEPLGSQPVRSPLTGREPAGDDPFLIDRLATRLGQRRLYRLGAVESDVPERSVRRLESTEIEARHWPAWPRPVRLLNPPERVDGVMALLPDGVPKRFTWRGRGYTLIRGDGPERIHGEWWRRPAERDSIRDYFQVEDQAGARFWLYRRGDALDDRTGDLSWHLHGLFA
jgi:protein ImuB